MRKSVYLSVAAAALLLASAALLQLPGREAAAQAGGAYINAVDLDINPADTAKFLEFVKENGACLGEGAGMPRVQHHGSRQGPEPRVPVRGL
jgi:hypothetical protein